MQRRLWEIGRKLGDLPSHRGPTSPTSMLEMPLPQARIKREDPVIIFASNLWCGVIFSLTASTYSFQSAHAGVWQLPAFSDTLPGRYQSPVCELCCGVTGAARSSHRKSSSLRGCTRGQESYTDPHALDTGGPVRGQSAIVPLTVCFGHL